MRAVSGQRTRCTVKKGECFLSCTQDQGVGAVDMEFSALCTVAQFRGIEFAAVLTVSDEIWGDSWRPGFSKQLFMEQKQAALKLLLAHLGNIGDK